jgi:iron complex outermembrane receptor protein
MNCKQSKLRDAVLIALAVGASSTTGAVFAQDSTGNAPTTLDRLEVTGSRIKRVEVEGPAPVTVISRQDIEASGEVSVSDFLRNTVYNSFGSARESSGSATGSASTISLRGLGSAYTLVLLDGRRMTKSASLDGGAANINLIPTAAVERIEILREGAGAVYGSDAIGGVVNVILRKDYEGLSFTAGYENPDVGPISRTASASAGISSERGNITFVLDHQEREMMYNRDIKNIVTDAGLTWGLSSFNSSAGFFGPDGLVSAPNCDTFENSIRTGPNNCGFDHGATSANESSLRRDALLVNGNYQINDNVNFFFRGIASDTDSMGVYASAPVDTYPTIAANNPYNPFGTDGTLYYRFTPLGTRDSLRADSYRDVQLGLQGNNDWFGGSDWELSFGHGRVSQSSVNYNYGLGDAMQAAIDAGNYNPFDPTHPSVIAAAPSIGHTVYVENEQRTVSIGGNIAFGLGQIGGRDVGFVTGFEYLDDRLSMVYDAQSAAGNVFGSAGAGSGGERSMSAVYFETLLPLLDTLNVTVAGRYDSYNDVGSQFSPRVALEFRPIDSLLVRGSWGKGFRAPTLPDMYGDSSTTNLNSPPLSSAGLPGGDQLACAALTAARQDPAVGATYQPYPVNPCATNGQYQWLIASNPNLKPEESKNWGVGFVWSPNDAFNLAVDYYDVELENVISNVPRALAFAYGDAGRPGYGVTRTPNIIAPNGAVLPGFANQILLPVDNGAVQTVRGIDLEASYRIQTGMGNITPRLSWTHTLEYDFTPIAADTLELAGTAGYPENRGQLSLSWDSGDWSAAAIANYIDGSSDGTPATTLPSWTTVDLQIGVALPWNGKVTVGVRNVGNKLPPMNDSLYGFPYYDNGLYNIWGRVPYLRYEQNF